MLFGVVTHLWGNNARKDTNFTALEIDKLLLLTSNCDIRMKQEYFLFYASNMKKVVADRTHDFFFFLFGLQKRQ